MRPLKIVELIGKKETMPSMQRSKSSAPESMARQAAALAVDELFRFCEFADTGDPEAFLAAAIGIVMQYPVKVRRIAFDPINGLPTKKRRLALCDIRSACDEAYEPIRRSNEREAIAVQQRSRLLPRPSASSEEKARVQAKLDWFLGRSPLTPAAMADGPSVFELDPADWDR